MKKQILRLYKMGLSKNAIAQKLGIDPSTVYYHVCPKRKLHVAKIGAERKLANNKRLKQYFGGKCRVCGYNRCLAALEFHHLDPNKKDFDIARIISYSFKTLLIEANKCVLLCGNCHRELHEGVITLNTRRLIDTQHEASMVNPV